MIKVVGSAIGVSPFGVLSQYRNTTIYRQIPSFKHQVHESSPVGSNAANTGQHAYDTVGAHVDGAVRLLWTSCSPLSLKVDGSWISQNHAGGACRTGPPRLQVWALTEAPPSGKGRLQPNVVVQHPRPS